MALLNRYVGLGKRAGCALRRHFFHDLNLSKPCIKSLEEMGVDNATRLQEKSIRQGMSGSDVALFAKTGVGKTLAYSVPAVEKLWEKGNLSPGEQPYIPFPASCRPRVLVIAPTNELCDQITDVLKVFSHNMKFRVLCVKRNSRGKCAEKLENGVDIVVSTPGQLDWHFQRGSLFLSKLEMLIIDEADTTIEDFKESDTLLERLLSRRNLKNAKNTSCQLFLASATADKSFSSTIRKRIKGIVEVAETNLHKTVQSLEQSFILCKNLTKLLVLKEHIGNEPTLIFCNTIPCCRAVQHDLSEHGYDAGMIHGKIPTLLRDQYFSDFKNEKTNILICTDVAARGLDIPNVAHVINFDFPKSGSDYIHRAGRTARFGSTGRLTNLYLKREKRIVDQINNAPEGMTHTWKVEGRGNKKFRGGMNRKVSPEFVNIKGRRPGRKLYGDHNNQPRQHNTKKKKNKGGGRVRP